MSTISIAGLQLEAENKNNLDAIEAEIDAAAARYPWLDMMICGELNALGTDQRRAEPLPGATEARFSAIARRHGIWLIPGSLLEKHNGGIFNTAPVINPEGEVIARYRKQFPWRPYEQNIRAGDQFVVFDIPGIGRFGVSICYDMWFQETLRTLTWMGAEVILHPSLTSSIDREAELSIVKASAAMYQCYFVDINLAGPLGVGRSIVAGPGGEVIYQAEKSREIIPLKLDLEYVREVRREGWNNLGQPLKSFRDAELAFPPYTEGYHSASLDALGPLAMPERGKSGPK